MLQIQLYINSCAYYSSSAFIITYLPLFPQSGRTKIFAAYLTIMILWLGTKGTNQIPADICSLICFEWHICSQARICSMCIPSQQYERRRMSKRTLLDKIARLYWAVGVVMNREGQDKMEGDTGRETRLPERCCWIRWLRQSRLHLRRVK